MAELASSVITLANAALVAIDVTVRYIKEVRGINNLKKDLLSQLEDLHGLVKTVTKTYNRTGAGDGHSASRYVGKKLKACQVCLDRLKVFVIELAALDTTTLKQKVMVKRQLDQCKKEIREIISAIHEHMEHIKMGLSLWSLEEQRAIRRISEAMAERQAHNIRTGLQDTLETSMPVRRTLSEAETVCGHDTELDLRRTSTAFSIHSRPSISSSLSNPLTCSERSNSIISTRCESTATETEDCGKFHAQVASCIGDAYGAERIRDILLQHPDPDPLAISTDVSGRTPLHLAAQRGDVIIGQLLLDFGADINAKDSEPASILDIAVAGKHRNFVEFLIKNQVDESNILDYNAKKFKDMKRIIIFEQKAANKKTQDLDLDPRPGVIQ